MARTVSSKPSHAGDGGCHQRAQPDQRDAVLDGGLDDRFDFDILAQVDDGVTVVLQHRDDDILADVMDVALDGRHDQRPFRLLDLSRFGEDAFEDLEGAGDGFGAQEQLRQEFTSRLVLAADFIQRSLSQRLIPSLLMER